MHTTARPIAALTAATALLLGLTACAGSRTPEPAPASAGTPTAAATATPATAAVSGRVRLSYAYSPDDDIRFEFEAEAAPFSRPMEGAPQGLPTDARGTVKVSHYTPALNRTVRSEGTVDCLVTGDRTATFTMLITRADPEMTDTVGQRRGFSVYDSGSPGVPDRFGFGWGVANVDTDASGKPVEGRTGTCMGPAPFAPVIEGGLTVRHTELPPLPSTPATTAPQPSR
ncbi:hypothetical protein ACIRBX_23580 [Kitasatospora sp. NPDC096147]|uniref:hypothetical protein n=1 Tax=Kitasatospora sp. NPDC096147 TaxID=3364093 RepID=UPI0037FA78DE